MMMSELISESKSVRARDWALDRETQKFPI